MVLAAWVAKTTVPARVDSAGLVTMASKVDPPTIPLLPPMPARAMAHGKGLEPVVETLRPGVGPASEDASSLDQEIPARAAVPRMTTIRISALRRRRIGDRVRISIGDKGGISLLPRTRAQPGRGSRREAALVEICEMKDACTVMTGPAAAPVSLRW